MSGKMCRCALLLVALTFLGCETPFKFTERKLFIKIASNPMLSVSNPQILLRYVLYPLIT